MVRLRWARVMPTYIKRRSSSTCSLSMDSWCGRMPFAANQNTWPYSSPWRRAGWTGARRPPRLLRAFQHGDQGYGLGEFDQVLRRARLFAQPAHQLLHVLQPFRQDAALRCRIARPVIMPATSSTIRARPPRGCTLLVAQHKLKQIPPAARCASASRWRRPSSWVAAKARFALAGVRPQFSSVTAPTRAWAW